jgi:hypothetical protein
VNTLCHELAHLRYFHHGERFKVFYQRLLDYARAQRLYRPGASPPRASERFASRTAREKPRAPEQLALF